MIDVTIYYPIARKVSEPASDKVRIEFVWPKRPLLFWSDKLTWAEKLPLPKGYGVAYYDFPTDKILMAPMPFNVLVGFLIWCYNWTRHGAGYWLAKRAPKRKDQPL